MVLVDTSVWVAYLRSPNSASARELQALLDRGEVVVTGVIMAEIVQGARTASQETTLGSRLRRLPYAELDRAGWLRVGSLSRELKAQGRVMGLPDLSIAVAALQGGHAVYTLDADFNQVPGLTLHQAEPK